MRFKLYTSYTTFNSTVELMSSGVNLTKLIPNYLY